MKRPINRILLVRTDKIGDVVLTTPAASIIRDRYPEAEIVFLSNRSTAPLLRRHRAIDRIIEVDGADIPLRDIRSTSALLRTNNFDAAICFYPRPGIALALALSGVPVRIGSGYRWYSPLFNRRIYEHRKTGAKHELELNLSLLGPLLDRDDYTVRFDFDCNGKRDIRPDTREKPFGGDYIIIHPGSAGSSPNLSVEQYRGIIDFLLNDTDCTIVLTGTPAEGRLIQEIMDGINSNRIVNAGGTYDLESLMMLISSARLLIASSTGPLHIAVAVQTPVVSFYCKALPCRKERWGPYRQERWVLEPDVAACTQCDRSRCKHGNCLTLLGQDIINDLVRARLTAER